MSQNPRRQESTDELIIRSLRAAGQEDRTEAEFHAAQERFTAALDRLKTDPAERARIAQVAAEANDPLTASEAQDVLSWLKFQDYSESVDADPVRRAKLDRWIAEFEETLGAPSPQD